MVDLSWSSVLKMNARVRRSGSSDAVTAAAVASRSSRSGSWSLLRASISGIGSSASGNSTISAEVCSVNRRWNAERPGDVGLGQHPLLRLGQLVRAIAARGAQVMAAELDLVGREQLLGPLVVELVPLELEEEQRGLDLRAALADLLEQGAALGVARVDGEPERRIAAGPADPLEDLLELAHRGHEAVDVQVGDLAAVGLGERLSPLARLVEERQRSLGAGAVDQRVEVPARLGQCLVGSFGCGGHTYDDTKRRQATRRASSSPAPAAASTKAPNRAICGSM